MLTAGQFVNEVVAARKGASELRPLLELREGRGYEAVRTALRKPPLNSIRKSCSKLLALLPESGSTRKAKAAQYESIKATLGVLDDGCRPDVEPRPDLLGELAKLEKALGDFGDGFGVSAYASEAERASAAAVAAE